MTLLYAALRRAETDAERLDALRAASPEELAALHGTLIYRVFPVSMRNVT